MLNPASLTSINPGAARHAAVNCRFAVPTLFLKPPFWFEAERCPWACMQQPIPRVLETTDVCATCPGWERRSDEAEVWFEHAGERAAACVRTPRT